jgi:hypothetical protein
LPWKVDAPRDTLAQLGHSLDALDATLNRVANLLGERYFRHARISANTQVSVSGFPVAP